MCRQNFSGGVKIVQKKHICGVEATQSTLLFVASKLCGQTISCGVKTAQTRDIFGIESKHVRQQYFVRSQSLAGNVFVESKLCRQTCLFVETQLCRHKCSYCSIKIVQTFFCGGKTVQTFYVWNQICANMCFVEPNYANIFLVGIKSVQTFFCGVKAA